MSHNLVLIGRVIVKAVIFQSFVLKLNKTERGHCGAALYPTTDPTKALREGNGMRGEPASTSLALKVLPHSPPQAGISFPFSTTGRNHNPILR